MFDCTFVYQMAGGASSDSLRQTVPVHSVPSVGDKVTFLSDGGHSEHVVKDVQHFFNQTGATHEIFVFYGEELD